MPTILTAMSQLLAVSPKLSVDTYTTTALELISPTDQFFLYEATGNLILCGTFSPEVLNETARFLSTNSVDFILLMFFA